MDTLKRGQPLYNGQTVHLLPIYCPYISTSEEGATSEQWTKCLSPMCPLFRVCTVFIAIKHHYTTMQATDSARILQDLTIAFSMGINLTCRCIFPSRYITNIQFSCEKDNLIVTGIIISTEGRNSTHLLEDFNMWLSSEPTVSVNGDELKVVHEKCEEKEESSKKHVTSQIIGIASGAVVAVGLLVVVVLSVIRWYRHR